MSTYWGIYCKTCSQRTAHGIKSGDGLLLGLIRLKEHIKALKEAPDIDARMDFSIMGWYEDSSPIEFIMDHYTHDLCAESEYGAYKEVQ